MNNKQEFINYVLQLMEKNQDVEMSEEARIYWEAFCNKEDNEKPLFTDNGKLVLQHMKDNLDIELWKAKDIAEHLNISSRTISGAMRKLVNDGFVEKVGANPVIYILSKKGKEIEII